MLRIFIGYDPREAVAFHVLSHSILRNSSIPVVITPLRKENLHFWKRPRGEYDSTDFAITRFLVPYLCDYNGYAMFMDCDMLMRGDLAEIMIFAVAYGSPSKAIHVVQHDYVPARERKFLDQVQTKYARKNWSSVMLFNCASCRELSLDYVANAPGLALHQFAWLKDDQIGELPKEWNYLVGEENQCAPDHAKLIHFTNGTPCFPDYAECEFADLWHAERSEMERVG